MAEYIEMNCTYQGEPGMIRVFFDDAGVHKFYPEEGDSIHVAFEDVDNLDYGPMMGAGEDTEEFFARLVNGPGNSHVGLLQGPRDHIFACLLTDTFLQQRGDVLDGYGHMTSEQRKDNLDGINQQMLQITGPVRPSTEYVGYW